ncbi:MAG: hypothetical protein ACTHK7_20875 [Aureliella sp.]
MVDRNLKLERKCLAQSEAKRRASGVERQRVRWLPKFWRDTGSWNDAVVSVFSGLSPLLTIIVCSCYFSRPLLGLLLVPVGWMVGMILGFLTTGVLSVLFGYTDPTER